MATRLRQANRRIGGAAEKARERRRRYAGSARPGADRCRMDRLRAVARDVDRCAFANAPRARDARHAEQRLRELSVMSTNGAVRAPRCASETAGNSAKKNMPGISPLANARDDARRHVPIGKSIAPRRRAWFACAATAAPST
ncbi:hypothetical protein BURPS1710b_0930 [Burkholderia pseudomallei 1710b]|uniref:Uncharacterized protein n=1 Tax=Burkholderia pseudomallei (strain 1710b) TaxID=320372 RepID=Q3JVR0_BURP1|nr:hypothetical protein BURPS1710b_0930 [Burkholderia pseudomallei 1710b]